MANDVVAALTALGSVGLVTTILALVVKSWTRWRLRVAVNRMLAEGPGVNRDE